MSKIYKTILVIILCFYTGFLSGQATITIDSINGQIVSGSQIIIDTIPTNSIAIPHLFVTNNSGSTKNWLVTRRVISQPNGWFNYLCWGGLCYGMSSSDVWSSNTTSINDSVSEELSIYVGAPSIGNAHYRYYISPDSVSFVDSVDIIIKVKSSVGIDEIVNQDAILFPNPTQNKIYLKADFNTSYDLMVYDITGRQVIDKPNAIEKEIDLGQLISGVYYFIIKNNQTSEILKQKIIISK